MPRMLVGLFVTVWGLVGAAHCYARGVHFGVAGQSGVIHSGLARAGFLDRHINFRGLATPGVVFVPSDDPYPHYPGFLPYLCYVALF